MNIIIFGTSSFSKLVRHYVDEDSQDQVVAYTVNRQYITEKEFDRLPVVPFEELESVIGECQIHILNTCGYKKMNGLREKIFSECKSRNFKICEFIHSSSKIETQDLGHGNIILPGVRIAPFVHIGDGNIFFHDVIINHDSVIGNFNYFSPAFICGGQCTIGNNNFFGLKSILRDSIHIGNHNLVGAAAYLSQSIDDETLVKPPESTRQQVGKAMLDILL